MKDILINKFRHFLYFSIIIIFLTSNIFAYRPQTVLSANSWKLIEIEGRMIDAKVSRAFISFDEEKQTFGGNAGCNGMGGNFKSDGKKLSFSGIISTKMYCTDRMADENAFIGELLKAKRFKVKNDTLYFMTDDKVILKFVKKND